MGKKIKIFIDHQIFTMQNFGGISRVFTELYRGFEKDNAVEPILPILLSDNAYIGEIKKVGSFLPNNKSFIKKLFYYLINRIYSTFKLLKGDFDIFVPTYYDPYFFPFIKNKAFVLVLHDMTHEIFPETVSKKDNTINWKKKLVHKADKIVAISDNTKQDIIKFYGIPENKIEVVYWATSLEYPKSNLDMDLPKRYILYVGNRKTYKNFSLFFEAITPLLKKDKDLYLVCAGGGKFSDSEISMIKEYGVENKVLQKYFKDDKELAYIYNKALCFVFPSLYEGFGIPVIEAFASGCPAIISNTSSLPEVGGKAVEYFNPEDKDSIRESVKKVVYDENLRKTLIKKGEERLKMFSWEKTAKQYLDIYRKLVK